MKNKVACCYLTHEHPEVVDEVLDAVCEEYGKRGIDIYVYDSSEDDDTKEVVEKYVSKGLCDLYYVPIQFTKGKNGGNEKYLYVLSGFGLEGDYDYIWPSKDRCWYSGNTLDEICAAIDEDHDIDAFQKQGNQKKHERTVILKPFWGEKSHDELNNGHYRE